MKDEEGEDKRPRFPERKGRLLYWEEKILRLRGIVPIIKILNNTK
jgi:hypothetical protein